MSRERSSCTPERHRLSRSRPLSVGTISVLTSVRWRCDTSSRGAYERTQAGERVSPCGLRTLWLAQNTVHRLLSRKRITGKKDGRKTMVYLPSVEAYVQSLPDR